MEGTYKALAISAKDYKESDKLLRLLTVEGGIITALMKGVKKPSAKLRFAAVPFAFCEYTLYKKSGFFVVTSCTQIEDLFAIAEDYDCYSAGCIMLEAADFATGAGTNPDIFISLLKSLQLILYSGANPYLIATAFLQRTIHKGGYAYEYPPPPPQIVSVMDLLSFLSSQDLQTANPEILNQIDDELITKTIVKLMTNFEGKFDAKFSSKKLLTKSY